MSNHKIGHKDIPWKNLVYFKNLIFILNPFPNKPWFLDVCSTSRFENTVGKGEIACYEQFLLFPQCFLPFWRTFYHFHQICNCRLQTLSIRKSLKFVVRGRVNLVKIVRMYVWIMYKTISKLGHVLSKSRSLGQFLEKPCGVLEVKLSV